MKTFLLFALAVFGASSATAQEVTSAQASMVISEGKVISSAPLTAYTEKPISSPIPDGTRLHEMFIVHDGDPYLCYLVGSTTSGTPPYSKCYGPKK